MFVKSTSYANFALVKYWGKKDSEKVIPFNDSVSVTWDIFKTHTILQSASSFSFVLNNNPASEKDSERVKQFLKHFTDDVDTVKVISQNTFPTAAGLASSASGFSALAVAANRFFNTAFDKEQLEAVTRKGSGSAVRSLYGGVVRWRNDGTVETLAAPIEDYVLVVVLLTGDKKVMPSREAMAHTVTTSPYFPAWIDIANRDANTLCTALMEGDFDTVGDTAQSNAMAMHASMLAATPPIVYLKDETMEVIRIIDGLRQNKTECFYTMDAGPNVKVISRKHDLDTVLNALREGGFSDLHVGRPAKRGAFIDDEG